MEAPLPRGCGEQMSEGVKRCFMVVGGWMCRAMGAEKWFAGWTDKDGLRVLTTEVGIKSADGGYRKQS